jgi:hypothetical protein
MAYITLPILRTEIEGRENRLAEEEVLEALKGASAAVILQINKLILTKFGCISGLSLFCGKRGGYGRLILNTMTYSETELSTTA